jgi:hypothetical protein
MPEIPVLLKESTSDGNISKLKSRYCSVLFLGLLNETESTGLSWLIKDSIRVFSSITNTVLLLKSEKDGARRVKVPVYGYAHLHFGLNI